MQSRNFYLDTQTRSFVAGSSSNLAASVPTFFENDIESINLYFLKPSPATTQAYDFADYSSNTIKFGVGTTTSSASQITWTAISTAVTATITTLVSGGSGTSEQQKITLSQTPVSGGWAIQLPSRNVTVSSVSAGVFTTTTAHGLYDNQLVTLSGFSISGGTFSNSAYYIRNRTTNTFCIATSPGGTYLDTAATTSGGGTAALDAITTGQLVYNATPARVQQAFIDAGLTIDGAPQILVTGTTGSEYTVVYANGSSGINFDPLTIAGSTLAAAPGMTANVAFNTAGITALVAAGTTDVTLEVEVSDGTKKHTYQTAAKLANDLIQ